MVNIPANAIAFIGPKGIPKDFPGTSGVEAYTQTQALRLVHKGKRVTCYIRHWASNNNLKTYRGIQLISLPTINTAFLDTISYSLLASISASLSNVTLVWYQGIGPAFFAFIPRMFHKRVYTTIHSLDWNRKKWGVVAKIFLRLCEHMAISLSDKVFVVSTQLERYYQDHYHKNTIVDKYAIVKRPRIPTDIIRRKYHLEKNGYILYLGRFVPEKRLEWLIKASSEVKGLIVVLAGGSSHSDGYVRYLKSISTTQNVVFTGYVFGREKAELISNCKLFVLPSALEGYPVAVSEALSYEKTCLVGDFLKSEYSVKDKQIHYFQHNCYDSFLTELKKLTNKGR